MHSPGLQRFLLLVGAVGRVLGGEPGLPEPRMTYLDNGEVRVGMDLALGGAVTHLSSKDHPGNLINSADLGRQIQMSHYSGPWPFVAGEKAPHPAWAGLGWNPIQTGDCYLNPSKVIEHRHTGQALYIKCVPMQWPLNNVPGDCEFETWTTLDGPVIHMRFRCTNRRADHTPYRPCPQELPAVYTISKLSRLMAYTGAQPFTGDALTHVTNDWRKPWPWTRFMATERWAALVDDTGWGLGVFKDDGGEFHGGLHGDARSDDPKHGSTAYLAPIHVENFDHNIVYEHRTDLMLGQLADIRRHFNQVATKTAPAWRFAGDRQHWVVRDATDQGFPLKGEWRIRFGARKPRLESPTQPWQAGQAGAMDLDIAYTGQATTARVFWKRLDAPAFDVVKSLPLELNPDGQYHTYRLDLGASPEYRGLILGLAVEPVNAPRPDEEIAIRSMVLSATGLPAQGGASLTTWPAPPGEALSEDHMLRVNGQPVPVYSCRVSAVPFNQVWPGYQRPLDQTELAGFAHWGMSAPVTVEVTTKRAFTNVVVRPGSRAVHPTVSGRTITFALAQPGQVTVELDGPHHALHLFGDPPETDVPAMEAAGVRYFGPGVHRPGKLRLQSGETLYLAGGAVVYTAVEARGASGVRIRGRGIIDTSEYARDQGGGCIRLTDCADVQIEGVILRDPDVWCLSAFGCRNVEIANVKLVGLWRYNADGIDLCNSENVVVRDSFVRAFDDAIVLKGLNWGGGGFHERPVRNVRVHDNVIWCDWGRALEIGAETSAPEITDVRFQDCDIIRTTHIAMDLQCGDRALVHDLRFENIRVEMDEVCPTPRIQRSRDDLYVPTLQDHYLPDLLVILIGQNPYSKDTERGNVRNITWSNVSVTGPRIPRSFFKGFDVRHTVEGIVIENLRLNGKSAHNLAEANLSLGPHVSEVRFATGAGAGLEAGTKGE